MRFILKLILIAAGCYAGQLYFPWWTIMVVPFLVNLAVKTKGTGAFLSSFLAVFGLWFIMALMAHQASGNVLTSKMATVLRLGGSAPALLIITAFLGGLAAALAGFTGNAFRNLFARPKEKNRRREYGRPDYRYR